jgi:hypothetical protein
VLFRSFPITPGFPVAATFAARVPIVASVFRPALLIARRAIINGLFAAEIIATVKAGVEIVAILVETLVTRTEALLLLLLTGAIVGQHAEIMVGKLEIIFGIHPVARHLRVAGHILVFLKKLGRVAARAVVDAVAIVTTTPIIAVGATIVIVPAAIAAAGLPVVDQDMILAFAMPKFTENTVQSPSPDDPSIGSDTAPPGMVLARDHYPSCQRRLRSERRHDFSEQGKRPYLSMACMTMS